MGHADELHERVGGTHAGGEARAVERVAEDGPRPRGEPPLRARARQRLHLVSALEEAGDQMTPEITGAAGNEYDRHCHALLLE
jgi:hypothetical protein